MAGDKLSLKITGDTPATFYLSNAANGINSNAIKVTRQYPNNNSRSRLCRPQLYHLQIPYRSKQQQRSNE